MKLTLSILTLFALPLFSIVAHADLGQDGCYQLYKTQRLFGVICLSGTTENGSAGSGVRVAFVGENARGVVWCSQTTSSGSDRLADFENHLMLNFAPSNGVESVEFDGKQKADAPESGKITLYSSPVRIRLDYFKLNARERSLLPDVFQSEKCARAGIGY